VDTMTTRRLTVSGIVHNGIRNRAGRIVGRREPLVNG
jgi:hypothetical protein